MAVPRDRAVGAGLVAVSAAAFGTLAIFGKVAYDAGGEPVAVLSLRFGLAAVVLAAVMALRRRRWPRGRLLVQLAALGGIGYVGQSLAFFSALTVASASLVAVLLYLYPALVVLLSRLVHGTRITPRAAVALCAAVTGTVLTVGPVGGGAALGVVLGVTAALVYSVYIVASAGVTARAGALESATVVIAAAALVYAGLAVATRPDYPTGPAGAVAAAGLALVATVVAIATFFAGLRRIGPGDAATLSSLEPVVTVLLAVALLGERVSPTQVAGGGLVLAAVVLLARAGGPPAPADAPAEGPVDRPVEEPSGPLAEHRPAPSDGPSPDLGTTPGGPGDDRSRTATAN